MIVNFVRLCSDDLDPCFVGKRYIFFNPEEDDASEFFVADCLFDACQQYSDAHKVPIAYAYQAFFDGGCKAEFFDVTECEEVCSNE